MALPAQVQAALDAADATLAEANAPSAAPTEDAFAVATPNPEPVAQAVQQPEVAPEPQPAPPQDDVWEQRYKVLQGKYNAEVPELHRRVHSLESNLSQAIERLNRASEVKEAAPEPQRAVDPRDVENFGGDLVDMVSRVATAIASQTTQALKQKADALEQQVASLTERLDGTDQKVVLTAEQMFFKDLTTAVPGWATVNQDPKFHAWLLEADPVYGFKRQDALRTAQQSMDVARVAAIFNAYLGPKPAVREQDPLANQVSPKSSATQQPAPAEKPILSQAQVTKFYDDVRRGAYRGNEQEAQRIEALINAALADGRVQ